MALGGKHSGVRVSRTSGDSRRSFAKYSFGTKAPLRANRSVDVVDGVPVQRWRPPMKAAAVQPESRLNDINPDDIGQPPGAEGRFCAALWGPRPRKGGVIMIHHEKRRCE